MNPFESFDKHPHHEGEDLLRKEQHSAERVGGFLMDLVSEKYKKKAAALLAALSIFSIASNAYAESENIGQGVNFSSDEFSVAERKENELVPDGFDLKKITDKITIAIGGKIEDVEEPNAEIIKNPWYDYLIHTEFYQGFSGEENNEVSSVFSDAIYRSPDAKTFFESLNVQKENLNDRQKVLFLQRLGNLLEKTYNYDMLEQGDRVEISDEKMYEALKRQYFGGNTSQVGICGNLSVFLEKTAKGLGMDAFIQSGAVGSGNDIFTGVVADIGGEKQIIFITYWGEAIPTGTLNLKKATGIFERAHGSITVFNSFVGNEKEMQFPIETMAHEEIEKATGFEKTEEMLAKNLEQGEIIKKEGLEISISPESKEIKLSRDSIILSYYNYQNVYDNPYQSLDELNALQVAVRYKGEKIGAEVGVSTVFMNIKDLYGGNVSQNDIIGRLTLEGMDSREITKGDYGRLVLNVGATLQAGIRLPMDKEIEFLSMGGMGEVASGARLMYFDPHNIGKFYIGADILGRGQMNDFQNQDLIIKEALQKITMGASVNVYEATIDVKAEKGFADWGNSLELSGAIKTSGGFEIGGKYETEKSEYEALKPSSEKIGLEAGWNGPRWGFVVSGFQKTEEYKDAEKERSYGVEAKLNIVAF